MRIVAMNLATQAQQAPNVLVAAPAKPEKIGFTACTVLLWDKPNRSHKVATSSVLFAIAHFRGKPPLMGPTPGMLNRRFAPLVWQCCRKYSQNV